MTGVMQGNWDAVVLAYTISFVTMAVYFGSILTRSRAAIAAKLATKNGERA